MTAAGGIFLLAVGAILRYATNIHIQGVSLRIIGLILMIAGLAVLIIALWQWVVWSRRSRQHVVIDDRPEVREPPRY